MDVRYSPDGTTIGSAGVDGAVRVWPTGIEAWIHYACTLAHRNLTKAEWTQYVSGKPYERTCPTLPSGSGAPRKAAKADYRTLIETAERADFHTS